MIRDNVYVWTINEDPEWTRHNAGISDMLLTSGMPVEQARTVAGRILLLRPDLEFELRDVHGNVLEIVKADPEPEPVKPSRRALGTRGQG
jgi:hypothetical protein